jgi:putative spermidine/putrescine transport system ATP-binding protein
VSRRIFAGQSSTYFVERAGDTIKVIVHNDGQARLSEGQDVVLSWSAESTVPILP